MPEKISVIIACFNDTEFLAQAIDSARNQTYPNIEIILIDDGSDSKTKEILKIFEPQVDRFITQENKGPGAARNLGIKEATGEYLLILDSDDYFEPDFCKMAVSVMEKHEEVKIVTCFARWFMNESKFQIYKPKGGAVENFLVSNAAVGNSLVRRNEVLDCGGYDENLKKGFEDWELFIRLLADGGFAHVIPEILFHYRKRKYSRSSEALKRKYKLQEYIICKNEKVYKKHFSFFIHEWLQNIEKGEKFKQQVMDSEDYKLGYNLLKPFRLLGLFKKGRK